MSIEIPTPESVRDSFLQAVADCIGPEGMGLPQFQYWNLRDKTLMCGVFDLPVDQPGGLFWYMINLVDDETTTDFFIAAVDMTAAPNQGLEFDDFLLILEFDRRRPEPFLTSQWRYGVINYRPGSQDAKIVRNVDWENTFWKRRGAFYMHRFGPPFRVRVRLNGETDTERQEGKN